MAKTLGIGLRPPDNMKLSKRAAADNIRRFDETGESVHSGMAGMLPQLIIAYRLTASPRQFYFLPADDCGGDCTACTKDAET